MHVFNLVGDEAHPIYQELAAENLSRQYSFLRSIVLTSLRAGRPMLSIEILKALNFHGICCLHPTAGEFRPCAVSVGAYVPPPHYEVPSRMQHFTNEVNRMWDSTDPVVLAAYVLWKLNLIHPFINGNGRTARAACHFILCAAAGGWLPGEPILPELIRKNRPEYVACLQAVDASALTGSPDLAPLHAFLSKLIAEQIASAAAADPDAPGVEAISLPAPGA